MQRSPTNATRGSSAGSDVFAQQMKQLAQHSAAEAEAKATEAAQAKAKASTSITLPTIAQVKHAPVPVRWSPDVKLVDECVIPMQPPRQSDRTDYARVYLDGYDREAYASP
jgi:hypothetical protein